MDFFVVQEIKSFPYDFVVIIFVALLVFLTVRLTSKTCSCNKCFKNC